MKISIYKLATLFFVVQSVLIAIVINNNYMKSYLFLQSLDADLIEVILGVVAILLNLVAVIVVRNLYYSGLEAERLKVTALKFDHIVEQNQIYRQHHHDFKNHITVVLGLLGHRKYTELKVYLDSYLHSINDALLSIETGAAEIDVLLSSKVIEARRNGILVDLTVASKVKCSRHNILDFVTIIGNLFDNALEGVQDLASSQKKVTLSFLKDPLDCIFEFTNPILLSSINSSNLLFKEGFSTKEEGRGNGLFIVKKLTERLEGIIEISTTNGLFSITISIPRHKLEG